MRYLLLLVLFTGCQHYERCTTVVFTPAYGGGFKKLYTAEGVCSKDSKEFYEKYEGRVYHDL